MKYMTFNSSCSYAGLANLLFFHGIDTEDREIALQMRLPYLFAFEDGRYLSGPMLQGAEWFRLYLQPAGFALAERRLGREEVCAALREGPPAMLGLRVSPESKHAVICTGQENGEYRFLNNKRRDSAEPDTLRLMEAELLDRLDEQVVVGRLERTAPGGVDYRGHLEQSVFVLRRLREDIRIFCETEQSPDTIRRAMDRLFRAVLLDGVTMLELLGERETADLLTTVRTQFLSAVKAERQAALAKEMDMARLGFAFDQYEKLIIRQMDSE